MLEGNWRQGGEAWTREAGLGEGGGRSPPQKGTEPGRSEKEKGSKEVASRLGGRPRRARRNSLNIRKYMYEVQCTLRSGRSIGAAAEGLRRAEPKQKRAGQVHLHQQTREKEGGNKKEGKVGGPGGGRRKRPQPVTPYSFKFRHINNPTAMVGDERGKGEKESRGIYGSERDPR